MQATTTMKRFVLNRAGGMAVAFIIVTGGAIGVTALAISSDDPGAGTVESARVMPKAFVSMGQGEGLIDAGNPRVVAGSRINAFTEPGQGEGLVDGTNNPIAQSTVQAYLGFGQGEGFAGPGGSIDRSLIDAQRVTLKAYTALGQGEGLVDPSNQPVATKALKAYPSPGQGEGLVGPGGTAQ